MRRTNIITGEKVMTEGNAIRHYTRLIKIAYKDNNYSMVIKLISEASRLISIDYCTGCSEDDIGYCGLRRYVIPESEKCMKWCIPNLIRLLEKEIAYMDSKKKHNGKGIRFKSDNTGTYLV